MRIGLVLVSAELTPTSPHMPLPCSPCPQMASNSEEEIIICGVCKEELSDESNVGCCEGIDCTTTDCPEGINAMCSKCGEWDKIHEMWRCAACSSAHQCVTCDACEKRIPYKLLCRCFTCGVGLCEKCDAAHACEPKSDAS